MTQYFDLIEDAINDLKKGKVIIVCDDEKRENEGDLIGLAEFATPEMISFMITHGRGLVCMPMTQEYAQRLNLQPMTDKNTDNFNTAFTISVDHISNSTGISAFDRSATILNLIRADATIKEFRRPGHMFPLIAKPLGVLERNGHTEAAVDLAILCDKKPAGVICEVVKTDGTMARTDDLFKIKQEFNLKMITISDLIKYRKLHDKLVTREAHAKLPTKNGDFTIVGYTNLLDDNETGVVIKGDLELLKTRVPLVRIHSECVTGDVFHSRRCDCGEQLNKSIQLINEHGLGIILYLRQEGRGIGLINKIKAYEFQDEGFDTIEANRKLGFPVDLRDYMLAAKILQDLQVTKIKLITNNPKKIAEIEEYGIKVEEVVTVKSTVYPENKDYLQTKAQKMGHFIY